MHITGDKRLTIPDLPSSDTSKLAEDEELISRLEICMSEWIFIIQSSLQREAQKHIQGKGEAFCPDSVSITQCTQAAHHQHCCDVKTLLSHPKHVCTFLHCSY